MGDFSNCIFCVIKPIHYLGMLMGSPGIILKCKHSPKGTSHEIKTLPILTFFSLASLLIAVLTTSWNFVTLLSAEADELVSFLPDFLFALNIILMRGTFFCKLKLRMKYYEELLLILLLADRIGMGKILPHHTVLYLRKYSIVLCLFMLIVATVCLVHIFMQISLEMLLAMHYIYVYVSFITLSLQVISEQTLNKKIFTGLFEVMRSGLDGRLCGEKGAEGLGTNLVHVAPAKGSDVLVERIKNVHLFYKRFMKTLSILPDILNPTFIICFLNFTVILILDIYLIAVMVLNGGMVGRFADRSNSIFFVHLSFLVFGTSLMSTRKLYMEPQKMVSYLYKSPLSKLTVEEVVQIEMLLETLELQKPIFKASDIVLVDTKIISSVIGTVTTYALVGLQFYASSKQLSLRDQVLGNQTV